MAASKAKQITVDDVDGLIAMCTELKRKAVSLREYLVPVEAPAPKRGSRKIGAAEKAKMIMRRNSRIREA